MRNMQFPDVLQLKLPPHSLEAEQAVLGGLMLEENAWDVIADTLTAGDFYRKDHRLIFGAIADLASEGTPRDALTVATTLTEAMLDEVGGLGYLGELVKNTPSAANIKAYAKVVRERSQLRTMIRVGCEISDQAYSGKLPAAEIAGNAMAGIQDAVTEAGGKDEQATFKSVLVKCLNGIDQRFQSDSALVGLSSGFTALDEATLGLCAGDLIVLAARPSMGKTTLAMNLVENACQRGMSVFVRSLEMTADSLTLRSVSSIGGIDHQRVRSGKLEEYEWPRLTSAVSQMAEWKLTIDDSPARGPEQTRIAVRRHARTHGKPALVMLDYIQLEKIPGYKSDSRVLELSEISGALKALAKEMGCPVVVLSQLNRGIESRPLHDRRPRMADIRDSGAIEQDADVILFLYRDVVYNPQTSNPSIAELIIGKQRNGPLVTVPLQSRLNFIRFENTGQLPDDWNEPAPKPAAPSRRKL